MAIRREAGGGGVPAMVINALASICLAAERSLLRGNVIPWGREDSRRIRRLDALLRRDKGTVKSKQRHNGRLRCCTGTLCPQGEFTAVNKVLETPFAAEIGEGESRVGMRWLAVAFTPISIFAATAISVVNADAETIGRFSDSCADSHKERKDCDEVHYDVVLLCY